MINLKTTVNVQQEIELNLETPAYFKNPSTSYQECMAVLDECTIEVLFLSGNTILKNYSTEERVREIKTAYDSWEHISEEEFFEALDKALKDFNFKPSLVTTSQLMEGEEDRRGAVGNW